MGFNKIFFLVFLLLCVTILQFSCKTLTATDDNFNNNNKLSLKSKFSTLIIDNNKFEYQRKNGLGKTWITSGVVTIENDKYILNSYDSIVSEQISFKSTEFYKNNLSNDSIKINIVAPLNNVDLSNNEFCHGLPYIVSFNKSLTSQKELKYYESINFSVAKSDIYDVYIYPKATCGYQISKESLFFILYIYKESTNFIEIELPDLNFYRFNYLNFVNYKLIHLEGEKYELQTGNNEILLKS